MSILTGDHLMTSKVEATYGVDSNPTAAANAMRVKASLSYAKVDMEQLDYDAGRPGSKGAIEKARWVEGSLEAYLAGSGTKNGIPAIAPLLKGAGLVLSAADDHVTLNLQDLNEASSTTCKFFRGKVRHDIAGCRSDWEIKLSVDSLPRLSFPNFKGLYADPTKQAVLPDADLSAFTDPLPVDPVTFTTQRIFDFDAAISEISFKGGNDVVYIPESREIALVNRAVTIEATFREPTPDVKNFYSLIGQYGAIAVQLGQDNVDEGAIFEGGAAHCQLTDLSNTERHGKNYLQAKFDCIPTARNNDAWFKFR